jgi:hypothetical protein
LAPTQAYIALAITRCRHARHPFIVDMRTMYAGAVKSCFC